MAATAIERVEVYTRDQDEAAYLTESVFATGTRPRFRRAQRPDAELRVLSASADQVSAERARCGLNFQITMEPSDYPAAFQVLEGWVRVTGPNHDARYGPGDVCLNPLGVPLTSEWQDLTIASMRVPLPVIADLAGELTAIDPASLRFDSARPITPAASRHWSRVASYVYRELTAPDSALVNPIVTAEVTRMAAAATLTTFANTAMTMVYEADPGDIAPAAVRRATAFIEKHAHEPITLEEIAGAARIGPRALQYAFRREYDMTPTAYLRRIRLARARQDLVAADPTAGDTVAAIAARWGFARPGRFAAWYHQVYGETPSRTLRS
jgi:AraC-like DNA-binding protein